MNLLFHGTSLVQFEAMARSGFEAREIYLGDNRDNITDHYAEIAARRDGSVPVTLAVDADLLEGLLRDRHATLDGDVEQPGQFVYSGPLAHALVEAWALDEDTGEERALPLGELPGPR